MSESFTLYIDIVNEVYRLKKKPGWTENELRFLHILIHKFKRIAQVTFAKYQPSGVGTSKWHSLELVVKDLRDVGGIEYLAGVLYEESLKRSKEDKRITSRPTVDTMNETLQRQEERSLKSDDDYCKTYGANNNKLRAVEMDSACAVEDLFIATFSEIHQCRTQTVEKTKIHLSTVACSKEILSECLSLGYDAVYSLPTL